MEFPKRFVERFETMLGDELNTFLEIQQEPLLPCIRINTLKTEPKPVLAAFKERDWELKQVPWYKNAYWIAKKDEQATGRTLEHHLGYYYIQEAASLIPPIALNVQEQQKVLDLAAAPGSKTTQLAQEMNNTGAIVANEPDTKRSQILRFNLSKYGVINTIVTTLNGQSFKQKKQKYHKILLDAPCSSEGTIRKNYKTLQYWSEKKIQQICRLQKSLMHSAFESLLIGGELVYSTCTLAPEEDEEVISDLLQKYENAKSLPVKIDNLKTRPGIKEWKNREYEGSENTVRVWPQDNDTEGFFIGKVTKEW